MQGWFDPGARNALKRFFACGKWRGDGRGLIDIETAHGCGIYPKGENSQLAHNFVVYWIYGTLNGESGCRRAGRLGSGLRISGLNAIDASAGTFYG